MKKNNIDENVSIALEEVPATEVIEEVHETREDKHKIHVVGKNESIWHVALVELGHGYRYHDIMELNGMTEEWISEGQILKIPEN